MFDAEVEETRVCRKCFQEKPFEDFAKSKKSRNGRSHECKPCRSANSNKWARAKRRSDMASFMASLPAEKKCTSCKEVKPASDFHKSMRDGLKSKCRDCRLMERRDYGRERARRKYYADRTLALRKMYEYRTLNRDKIKEYNDAWSRTINGKSRKLVGAAKHRADRKGLPFNLDVAWCAERLWGGKCEATGLEMHSTGMIGDTPWAPSIDRIVPELGYVKSNCRVVCYIMNTAKNGFTDDDVETFCVAFLQSRGKMKDRHEQEN